MASRETNVAEYLLAGKDELRVALQVSQAVCSYGQLTAYAGHIAAYLLKLGAPPGDRVLLASDNSIFWVACYLGTMQAGCVTVPIPANSPISYVKHVLETTGAAVVCVQGAAAKTHAASLEGKHVLTDAALAPIASVLSQSDFPAISSDSSPEKGYCPVREKDLAALIFTSGSTGQPRGVMISHRNIMANTESINAYLSLTESDRMMAVLPFHYCFGASLLHTHLRVGGEVVIENRFLYPELVLQRLIKARCTGFAGVPSHFQILLRNSTLRKKQFPDLRYVQQAGGHLAPTFVKELKEALPGTKIVIMYGQTEATARLSFLPPEQLEAKLGSIGRGMPGVTLRVLNENGYAVEPGEVGEIVADGPNVALGYWNAPEETAAIFRDGRLHTGDLARVDEEGYIYVVDRAKDFIKCRGEKVSCRQLEEVLLEYDELLEAAVIGYPDTTLGEAVKAFIVPCSKSITGLEERLIVFCKGRLLPHLVPKAIVILPSLPKNDSGKVMKQILKAADTSIGQ